MLLEWFRKRREINDDYAVDDYHALMRYIEYLARHKMGYPVSLLTYLGVVDNTIFGIQQKSLANILLNNVGDPEKDSETSLLEVKKHEREIIKILAEFYGLDKDGAKGYVTTGGTEGNFAALWWSKRYLISKALEKLVAADDEVKLQAKQESAYLVALAKTPLTDTSKRISILQNIIESKNLAAKNKNISQQILTPTVFYTKGFTHYSVTKVAEILRLNMRAVAGNDDGSIDLNDFKKELIFHLGAHPHSSIIVVANIGATLTGAIDDVPGIKAILDAFENRVTYTIHLDGALSGFVLPILKPFGDIKNYFMAIGAHTLSISAHKYPGLPQPSGIVLADRAFFQKAFEKAERIVEYVGNIQDVTISGSRSGLNVLMFYQALSTLGLTQGSKKLKAMVEEDMRNARYLHDELVKLYGPNEVSYPHHFHVIFPRPTQDIAKKYQLMLTGDRATICVLPNVTKALINEFIADLKQIKQRITTMAQRAKDLQIQTLETQFLPGAVDMLARVYATQDAMIKSLGVHRQDLQPLMREVCIKAINDGLGVIALDGRNKVCAALLATDAVDRFVPKPSNYPRLKPFLNVYDQLQLKGVNSHRLELGILSEVWIAAFDPQFLDKDLIIKMWMSLKDVLLVRGYRFLQVLHPMTWRDELFNEFHSYQRVNDVFFAGMLPEHVYPFQGASGHVTSYLFALHTDDDIVAFLEKINRDFS